MILLSIIIPTFNEIELSFLRKNLLSLTSVRNIEIICVDSNSTDGTSELIDSFNIVHLKTNTNIRAKRLNLGIEKARGRMVLLNHPRSIIDIKGILYLRDHVDEHIWGGFYHLFDRKGFMYEFTSWYSNYVRSKVCSIIYLDHCIFFNKDYFLNKGLLMSELVPNIHIFEDTQLAHKLNKFSSPDLLPYYSKTSSIRFVTNGFFKQSLLNQFLKIKFFFGGSDFQMNKIYEKELYLNSLY